MGDNPNYQAALAYMGSRNWTLNLTGPSSAQVIKPKHFSVGAFLAITILSVGTLFWVYPLYHFARKAETGYLEGMLDGGVRLRLGRDNWLWNGRDFSLREPKPR